MNKNIVHRFIPLWGLVFLLLSSCSKEEVVSGEVPDGGTEVTFELTTPDFTRPASRATDTDIEELYAIVFTGDDGTAAFSQVKSKTGSGSTWTIPLTAHAGDCMILLIANPKGFLDGTTPITNLETWLASKTLQDVCDALNTGLIAGSPTTPPYGTAALPMTAVIERTSASGAQGIAVGNTINVQLVRSLAKVTVTHDAIPNFKVLGIERVYNVARQGMYHNLGTTVTTSGGLTDYIDGTNLLAASSGAAGSTGTTAATPVYLHETAAASESFIIIRAEYNSQVGYFKLNFRDDDQVLLDITRNTNYIMHITHADNRGFDKIEDAVVASVSTLSYTVTATDLNALDVVYNGYYYLGFSNSRIQLNAPNGAHTMEWGVRIVTDSPTDFTTNSITASPGLTVTPTKVTPNGTTNVDVTVASGFTNGTITVKFGTLEHTITVSQSTASNQYFPLAGGVIKLTGIHSAEYIYRVWFTPDGNTDTAAGTSTIQTYNGEIYVHVASASGTRYNEFYGSSASFLGRTRYVIYQGN